MRLLAFSFQVKTQQPSSDMNHTDPIVNVFMGEFQFLSGAAKEICLLILDDHIKIFLQLDFLQLCFLCRLIR